MKGQVQTRVVDTGGAAKSTIINRDPTEIHWISISAQALATQGMVQIYDGFDAGGRLMFQIEPGYSRQHVFSAPIVCNQGLFVYADANIASYTIGFCSLNREVC